MSYNIANFDQTVHSDGTRGTVQVSDGNLGFEGANGVTINSLGDITANAFFGYTSSGGGGGGDTPSLQAVTVVGASTNRAMTISNSLTVTGNLFVTGNLVSVDTENLIVQDPIIQLANNSTSDTANIGIIFTRPTSNIVIGWRGNEDEVMIGFSTSSASGTDLDPLDDNKLNLKVYGNVEATGLFLGNANLLSNIVNSDVGPGIYGNTTHVTQITISDTGRISTISNIEIQERSNLDQVVNRSNVTSNTLEVGGLLSTGNIEVTGLFLGNANLLSNIVNSDITPGTYGSGIQVPQIVIGPDHRIASITNVPNSGGDVGTLQDVSDTGNTTSNTIQFTNPTIGLVTTGNVEVQGLYLGNANLLSNIVNSDVGPATYGNTTHVTQITVTDTGRISGISNVEIQERSNLDQVVNRGNVTSNTVQFTNSHTALVTDLTSNVEIKIDQLSSVAITDLSSEQMLLYDGTNWVNDYSVRNFAKIINKTGDILYRGNAVYIVDGHNSNVANVALADASDSSKMPSIGFVFEDIADSQEGVAVTYGKVQNVNTDNFIEGETVYVSNTQVGGFSNIKPTINGDFIQNVGVVVKSDPSHGVVFVTGVGRTNDIPNGVVTTEQSDMLYMYGETAASRFAKITPQNFRSNLEQVVNTGNVTSNTVQFTNPETSLITSGNVYINGPNPYASLNVNNPTSSNVIYVQSQTTSNSLISFLNTQTANELGNEYPSLGCSGNDLVFYPGVPRELAVTISADKNMTVVGNVEVQGLFLGNANLLSNIVNSDVGPATYGNTTHVTQITITDTGRISSVSNVEIQERSNLDQVVNRGNVTSNSIQVSGIVATGQANVANIYVSQSVGAGPTVSSNIITVDQAGHSYKFFRVPVYPTGSLEGLAIQNATDGCQTLVDIYPIGGDLDVFQNFSNGGAGPTVLTSLNSNLVINTGNHVMISCVTDLSNTFVNIIGFY